MTFLFTDIEGSTRRWESDADSMRSALAAHDEVLRTVIDAHDGFVFSHTGDGVAAAFASPRSAVDAAMAAQRQLALPVRMGLATGEAELRDRDYFGPVLNRAARLMAAGHGGQILLADSTAGLLTGIDLLDHGPRRLRDLPTPVGVFQVLGPGLPERFPPLQTLDVRPGNLRAQATTFIGRESDVAELQAAVRSHRCVTLTGVGGVGKTRLALEAAAQLSDDFADGVWIFELAAVTDPDAVPDAVAAVLGISQQPGKNVAESVAAALEGRTRLLVLDNCEHVLEAAADLIRAILDQSATVRIVATSREGLNIAEEQVWPVRSLDVETAEALFVERAHRVSPGFSADDPDAVVEICRRLDGIPLAIELAASRISSMTARDVRDRLDQRFKLLVGTRRGLERHQTLRQAVQWSYDLLGPAESALLVRCSVFAGGFDVRSACSTGGFEESEDFEVLDLLDSLVRKSLVITDRSSGRTRYSMLETIRQFAEEQLAARGEADATRTAHARHFAGCEPAILALWDSPRQSEAYAWFAVELANLRTAYRWAAEKADLDVAAPIATCAALLGVLVENYEPVTWCEELIEPARAVNHPRLAALYAMATQCLYLGRAEDCVRYGNAGQAAFLGGRDTAPPGFESWLGSMSMNAGQPERAVQWCGQLVARGTDPYGLASLGLVLGLMRLGSQEEAMRVAKGSAQNAVHLSNPWAHSFALLVYGMAFCDADTVRAREALRSGLALARESGNRGIETHLTNVLGRLEARYGDPVDALGCLAQAIRHYHDSGNTSVLHISLAVLVVLLQRLGRAEPSAVIAGHAFGTPIKGWIPEFTAAITALRGSLGDRAYTSLTQRGESMTTSEVVTYAYDQVDGARIQLSADPR